MRWNPTMPTTHKIKLTDIIDAGLAKDIKTLRGMPGPDRLAEIRREQGYHAARCRKCGRLATDRGGIIVAHDPHKLAEDVADIGWAYDAGQFTCPTCGKEHQH